MIPAGFTSLSLNPNRYNLFVLPTLLVFAIVNCSNEQSSKSISNLSSFKDSTSYALGADLGENLRRQNVDIDYDVFVAGLTDGMETGLIKLDQKQRREVMATLQKKLREKMDLVMILFFYLMDL